MTTWIRTSTLVAVFIVSFASDLAFAQTVPRSGTQFAGTVVESSFALRSLGPNCHGYASSQPSHVLQVNEPWEAMQITVRSPVDTTMTVQLPNGEIRCDDDGGGSNNPQLTFATRAGQIRVWVGAFGEGETAEYSLSVQQAVVSPTSRPATAQGTLDPGARPRFAGAEVRAGFEPQMLLLSGEFGGNVSASTYGRNCRGYADTAPSHLITARTPFNNLRFLVHGGTRDTSLIVQFPDGRIVCNDDSDGHHPMVDGATRAGVYRIWVAAYAYGETGPYRLAVTELGIRPSSVPDPSSPVAGARRAATVQTAPVPSSSAIELLPRIPVTVFGPDIPDATLALWGPRSGEVLEVGVRRNGNGTLAAFARISGNPISIDATIPPELTNAVVTLTERPDGRLLLRADSFVSGRSTMFLIDWQRGNAVVTERWTGALRARAPRWSR